MWSSPSMPRKARTLLPAAAVAAGLLAGCMPPEIGSPWPGGGNDGWKLTWQAEWNEPAGTQPSRSTWTYDIGNRTTNGWGNQELQYYTDSPNNVATDGQGNLVIATRKAAAGASLPCWNGGNCAYTSARITTKGRVTLTTGRLEARIKVPAGIGLWSAFWMMGANGAWPTGGEIDVMESVGQEVPTVFASVHGPHDTNVYWTAAGRKDLNEPLSAAFHDFAVEKRPGDVRFFVDGQQYFRVVRSSTPAGGQWVFDQPFYMLLNLAVGGSWPGPPNAQTVFPARMLVDWVRLYS